MQPFDLISLPSNVWQTISLGEAESAWSKNENKEIVQTELNTKGWGSLLLPDPEKRNFDTVALRCNTPDSGEVGLVFHFQKEDSFLLLSIKYLQQGMFRVALYRRQAGVNSLLKETDLQHLEPELNILVASLHGIASIQVGNITFDQELQDLPGQVGLFSNQTKNAVFKNFAAGNLISITDEVKTESTPAIPEASELMEFHSPQKATPDLNQFLKITAPKSETQVDFSEVFTVPLDNFYVSLYRNYGDKPILFNEQPLQAIPGSIIKRIGFDNAFFYTIDLSPSKFILVCTKGITKEEQLFQLPPEAIYTALYDKETLAVEREYTQIFKNNEIKGYLPIAAHLVQISFPLDATSLSSNTGLKRSSASEATMATVDPKTKKVKTAIPFKFWPYVETGFPLAISPDASKILCMGLVSGNLTIWNLNSSKATTITPPSNADLGMGRIFFSPDSTKVLILEGDGKEMIEYATLNGAKRHYPAPNTPEGLAEFSAVCYATVNEQIVIYSANSDGKLRLWPTMGDINPEELFTLTDLSGKRIGVSPDGKKLFVLKSKEIRLHKLSDGTLEQTITLEKSPEETGIWFSPDGKSLCVNVSNELLIYQLKTATTEQAEATDDTPASYSYLLDYRHKHWYRNLKLSLEQEEHFNALAKGFKQVISDTQTELFTKPATASESNEKTPSFRDHIDEGLYLLNAYQQKLNEATSIANRARDAQQDISSALRMNGYNLVYKEDDNTVYTIQNGRKIYLAGDLQIDDELTNKGYDFAIVAGTPRVKAFSPFKVDTTLDYKNNGDWSIFFAKLAKSLFDCDALTQEKKKIFESQGAELKHNGVNKKIQHEKERLEKVTDVTKEAFKEKQGQIQVIDEEIGLWQKEKDMLKQINLSSFKHVYDQLNDKKTNLQKLGTFLTLSYTSWGDTTQRTYVTGRFLWVEFRVTRTLSRSNYRYTISFSQQDKSKTGWASSWNYATGEFDLYNNISGTPFYEFVQNLIRECDKHLIELSDARSKADMDMKKLANELLFHSTALQDLETNALAEQRKKFVNYWNDPSQFGAFDTVQNVVMPDSDPLTDLLVSLQYSKPSSEGGPEENEVSSGGHTTFVPIENMKWKTDYFSFSGDRFYNEEGLTLQSYLEFLKGSKSKRVAIFPKVEDDGLINKDAFIAVVNPQPAISMDDDLPVIKFVETYRIGIQWTGYSLGELSHTENLFPNETKEIKIERTLKLVRKNEQSSLSSQTTSVKTSSSFEENLQKEISKKDNTSKEQETSTVVADKVSGETTSESQQTKSKDYSLDATLSSPVPSVIGGSLTAKTSSKEDSTNKNSRKDTFEKSQTQNSRAANKESHEAFAKDTSNTIRKVAGETSQENKVEVRVSSMEESTSSDSRSEIIKLENPNIGRTVNYNFFQMQNGYKVTTTLTDVKIVVDMNREVIKGSTVTDVRVFDLEELGKIFADENEDPRYLLTAAIIARQAFKNYLTGIPGIGRGNGALRLPDSFIPNLDYFESVNFSKKLNKNDVEAGNLMKTLYEAMSYLKQVPFTFKEVDVTPPKEFYINAGGYFLDSEVGHKPATEEYLETRRDIETEYKKAELAHLKEQTKRGVFYQTIPATVTHLNCVD